MAKRRSLKPTSKKRVSFCDQSVCHFRVAGFFGGVAVGEVSFIAGFEDGPGWGSGEAAWGRGGGESSSGSGLDPGVDFEGGDDGDGFAGSGAWLRF